MYYQINSFYTVLKYDSRTWKWWLTFCRLQSYLFHPIHLQLKKIVFSFPKEDWGGGWRKRYQTSRGGGDVEAWIWNWNCKTVVGFILQMVEVMEGSSVYWYSHQRAYCSAFKSWPGYINASIDIFFNKDTLAACCAMGNEKKSNGHQPLNQVIIQALIGKLHCILKWHLLLANTE